MEARGPMFAVLRPCHRLESDASTASSRRLFHLGPWPVPGVSHKVFKITKRPLS